MTGIREIKEAETKALQSIEKAKTDAEKMIEAGADRIGASASVAIVTGKKAVKGKY